MAGYEVVGIDHRPQKRYVGERFIQADAMAPPVDLSAFDLIWASPPCERYTMVWRGRPERREGYPDLIEATRSMLRRSRVRFVIENVPGAPLRADCVLEGAMFDLPLVRKRLFEVEGFTVPFALSQQHRGTTRNGDLAMVAGHGGAMKGWTRPNWNDPATRARLAARNSADGWREALGIDWMSRAEMSKAIPPAYAEFIGRAAQMSMTFA